MKTKYGILCEMIAVAVHSDYTGRGIAKELTKLLLENSKKQGYFMSKAECTSLFSTKALVKSGAVIEKTVDYASFTVPGGCCSKPKQPFKGKVGDIHKNANLTVFRHFPESVIQAKMTETNQVKPSPEKEEKAENFDATTPKGQPDQGNETPESEQGSSDEVDDIQPKKKNITKQRQGVSAEVYGAFNKKADFVPKVVEKSDETKEKL